MADTKTAPTMLTRAALPLCLQPHYHAMQESGTASEIQASYSAFADVQRN